MKLADEVEELFVKNFTQDDRRKAMKYLRPDQRKESHAVTFFIGEYWTWHFFCFSRLSFGNESFWYGAL